MVEKHFPAVKQKKLPSCSDEPNIIFSPEPIVMNGPSESISKGLAKIQHVCQSLFLHIYTKTPLLSTMLIGLEVTQIYKLC